MTLEQFQNLVEFHMTLYRDQRLGQALFNTLVLHDPDTAEDLRCSGIDPFNNDEKVPAVIEWLYEREVLTV